MVWLQNSQALDTLDENFQTLAGVVSDIQASSGGSSVPVANTNYFNAGSGTTFSPNYANGATQEFTLTGNATINAVTGASPGWEIVLILVQDATGGRQVTSWDASFHFPGQFDLDPTAATATCFVFGVNGAGNLFLMSPPTTQLLWP